jgi:ribonuclease P protein component
VDVRSQAFTREDRILKRLDFIKRKPNTRKIRSQNFLVIIRPNPLGRTRLGLSVGKNRGGAVERNRIKRLLREFFRKGRGRLPASQDIIIIAQKGSNPLTYRQVLDELAPLLNS